MVATRSVGGGAGGVVVVGGAIVVVVVVGGGAAVVVVVGRVVVVVVELVVVVVDVSLDASRDEGASPSTTATATPPMIATTVTSGTSTRPQRGSP